MTDEELNAIEARANAAKPQQLITDLPSTISDWQCRLFYCVDVPALIAEVRRLQSENADLKESLKQEIDSWGHPIKEEA